VVRLHHLLETANSLRSDANVQSRSRATAIERAHFRKVWTLSNGFLQLLLDPEILAAIERRVGPSNLLVIHAAIPPVECEDAVRVPERVTEPEEVGVHRAAGRDFGSVGSVEGDTTASQRTGG